MLFNSMEFAWFFVVVYALFAIAAPRYRNLILLLASCHFYAAFIPKYLLVLFAVIVLDYVAGILLERYERKRTILILSLIGNIGILAVFKYYNFFTDNVNTLATSLGWNYALEHLAFVLPIGLSFHTFQSMSYTIEVYRGHQRAERNFLIYALYVLYFPQLVAGPIERPQNMLSQFRLPWKFDYERAKSAMQLIACGLVKKCVVADTLALLVNQAYAAPQAQSGASLLLASYFFAWQIFCDFSGYSDIARGTSRLFGIELMLNFNKPYLASSLSDFWRRWHISLSTWFRDYLYIPLGGNRLGFWRQSFNLIVVFLLSGFWHGANWTFIIWGGIHWALLTLESLLPKLTSFRPLKIFYVFNVVTLAWVFFRAPNLREAILVLERIFTWQPGASSIQGSPHFTFGVLSIFVLFLFQWADRNTSLWERVNTRPSLQRWAAYASLIFVFLLFGQFNSNQFIYFQF